MGGLKTEIFHFRGGYPPTHLEIFQLKISGLSWSLQGLVEFKAERQALKHVWQVHSLIYFLGNWQLPFTSIYLIVWLARRPYPRKD